MRVMQISGGECEGGEDEMQCNLMNQNKSLPCHTTNNVQQTLDILLKNICIQYLISQKVPLSLKITKCLTRLSYGLVLKDKCYRVSTISRAYCVYSR